MGRLEHEPVIQHFSHPHPLELSNFQQALAPSTCVGCRLRASGWTYACKACSYVLHITCAQMPQFINHPADPSHALALLAVPAYPEGFFNCDACGQKGVGFSYHCGTCSLDVHTLCASMPLSVTHQAHPPHPLALAFFPPYQNKGFSCDICGNTGTNHWLYRCAVCEFDVHLGCATAKPRQQAQQPQSYPTQQPRVGAPLVGVQGYAQQRPQFQQVPVVGMPAGVPWQVGNPGGVPAQAPMRTGSNNQAGSSLVGQAYQGFVQSAAQQAGQSLVQSIFGGGGGGGGGNGGGIGDGGQDGSSNPVIGVIGAVFGGGDSSNSS
ncbi:hypothetical protein Taro_020434 [Colocasia esculenta]|uniref:DC1 domain-containing protein n=1 Tax=Colocasia esculenta TaxID=4460 RepID=A0A843UW91_COLES|nr:hypothetical protein [Colocasia esculenta]